MKTAPRDGTPVLLVIRRHRKHVVEIGDFWVGSVDGQPRRCWMTNDGMDVVKRPLHWMPLPEPPK